MFAPPLLAAFLDYGGDVATFPGIDGLAEAVVVRRRLNTPAENAEAAAACRSCVAGWLHGTPSAMDRFLGDDQPTQAMVTAFAWAAECFDDPTLAERFERALPTALYLEHIRWVGERRARAGPRGPNAVAGS